VEKTAADRAVVHAAATAPVIDAQQWPQRERRPEVAVSATYVDVRHAMRLVAAWWRMQKVKGGIIWGGVGERGGRGAMGL